MTVEFLLDGVEFIALNGGPNFKFTEAVSFVVYADMQEEIDYYWEKLAADGGEPGPCSWLKDKFGLSWQVQPRLLIELLGDSDKAKSERVMNAMMEMTKIDIAALEKAARSK
jgi:predicted 3-demethylubiquinone-9 3-methyltransferase (glyoxalase superfamily)